MSKSKRNNRSAAPRHPTAPSRFEAEAHAQSLAVAQSLMEPEDQAFVDAVADVTPDSSSPSSRTRKA